MEKQSRRLYLYTNRSAASGSHLFICHKSKHSEDINQNEAIKEFFAMDTCITMTAYGVNAEDALTEAADKLSALEQIWSVTDSGSDIYAINHGSGQPVSVSEETAFFQTCKVLDPFHILFKVFL